MILPAVNATGSIQPSNPWAFYEYLQPEDPRYRSHHGLVISSSFVLATGLYLLPSNTVQFSYKPENIIRGPLSIASLRGPSNNLSAFADDLLDWDAGVGAAPPRPSGKISVTLHYAGRGVPRRLEDY
jgi:hypothetical protein